ncbi:class I adenylate-forming enzyme family protein [Micromonospora sp. NPDC005806]|uniref:class I adenylate-forming enzyme family protein n=1 Tax=Micromonospora sp. NPDC005806 TaxID=3364234 RepID=UPI0036C0720F
MITAGEAVRSALLAAGDRPLLLDPKGRVRTGAQLVERVDALAGALLDRGAAGARVGLWYRNSLPAIEAFLAVEWVGGTRVPVDPGAPPAEARAVFAAAGVALVLADAEHADGDDAVHDHGRALRGTPAWPAQPVPPERTLLLYPRQVVDGALAAVPISYGSWAETMRVNVACYLDGRYGMPMADDDVYLTVQQLMHGTGLLGTFPFLHLGLPQVVLDRFDPDAVCEAVARFGVTSTMLVSAMLPPLATRWRDTPLRRVLYGGAPLTGPDLRTALAAFGPVLVQVYGRLEGGWPISVLDTQAHTRILAGDDELLSSCGFPLSDVEVQLRPTGDDPDVGELAVRTPMAAAEYLDADGWCPLGDVVRRDRNGYLHHLGRLDQMINNGYHVYPAEVEYALRQLPGVLAARVVGERDPRRGQRVVAYVVPSTAGTMNPDDIRQRLRERLAGYKVPERIEVVTDL